MRIVWLALFALWSATGAYAQERGALIGVWTAVIANEVMNTATATEIHINPPWSEPLGVLIQEGAADDFEIVDAKVENGIATVTCKANLGTEAAVVNVTIHLTGEIRGDEWSGTYAGYMDDVDEAFVGGTFSAQKHDTLPPRPSPRGRPPRGGASGPEDGDEPLPPPATGELSGAWRGTLIGGDGEERSLGVELAVVDGKYAGTIHLVDGDTVMDVLMGQYRDGTAMVTGVFEMYRQEARFGLIGKMDGSTWTGQYSLVIQGNTLAMDAFVLSREQ